MMKFPNLKLILTVFYKALALQQIGTTKGIKIKKEKNWFFSRKILRSFGLKPSFASFAPKWVSHFELFFCGSTGRPWAFLLLNTEKIFYIAIRVKCLSSFPIGGWNQWVVNLNLIFTIWETCKLTHDLGSWSALIQIISVITP